MKKIKELFRKLFASVQSLNKDASFYYIKEELLFDKEANLNKVNFLTAYKKVSWFRFEALSSVK